MSPCRRYAAVSATSLAPLTASNAFDSNAPPAFSLRESASANGVPARYIANSPASLFSGSAACAAAIAAAIAARFFNLLLSAARASESAARSSKRVIVSSRAILPYDAGRQAASSHTEAVRCKAASCGLRSRYALRSASLSTRPASRAATDSALQQELERLGAAADALEHSLPSFTCSETGVSERLLNGKVKEHDTPDRNPPRQARRRRLAGRIG